MLTIAWSARSRLIPTKCLSRSGSCEWSRAFRTARRTPTLRALNRPNVSKQTHLRDHHYAFSNNTLFYRNICRISAPLSTSLLQSNYCNRLYKTQIHPHINPVRFQTPKSLTTQSSNPDQNTKSNSNSVLGTKSQKTPQINDPPKPPLPVRILISFKNFLIGFGKFISSPTYALEKSKQLWHAIVRELKHLWHGMKLLVSDVRILLGLLNRVTKGKSLTRREKRQAQRTTADLFRLVPFLAFVLIPFMEFLLPVAIKIFPNMLPSQFQTKHQRAEKFKRQLQLRLNMAEFLQGTVEQLSKELSGQKPGDLKESHGELVAMLESVRKGNTVDNASILKVAKLFEDELTIDNAPHRTLVSMCRYMGLRPYGTDAWLRMNLLKHLNSIRRDDRLIRKEGVDTLTLRETKVACRERGMRATDLLEYQLRNNLEQWLELSIDENVPPSLLILSRTFTVYQQPHEVKPADPAIQLKSTLKTLADPTVEELLVDKMGVVDLQKEREIVQRQDALIKEEREEKERQAAEEKEAIVTAKKEGMVTIQEIDDKPDEEEDIIPEEQKIEQLKGISEALAAMASDSPVGQERVWLEELQKDAEVLKKKWEADIGDESEITEADEELQRHLHDIVTDSIAGDKPRKEEELVIEPEMPDIAEPIVISEDELLKTELEKEEEEEKKIDQKQIDENRKALKTKQEPRVSKLQTKVETMLENISVDIDKADEAIGRTLKILDEDQDGVMTYDEVTEAIKRELKVELTDEQTSRLIRLLDRKGDMKIDVEELEETMDIGEHDDEESQGNEDKKSNK